YSLKRELQQGMNNFYNTLTAFNKIAANRGAGTPGIDNETIDDIYLQCEILKPSKQDASRAGKI
ncbi:MAG: hypothetical protein Q8807_04035, partial ['Waltheria sp.' little leaf phytoplasma]|nr:hypothetical protein ['Waltheria sp.' little leaf phytoplasma]